MPQIIVTAGNSADAGDTAVTLRERINAEDFESERWSTRSRPRPGSPSFDDLPHRGAGASGPSPGTAAAKTSPSDSSNRSAAPSSRRTNP